MSGYGKENKMNLEEIISIENENKRVFLEYLRKTLSYHPLWTEDVLRVVTDSLSDFRQSSEQQRNSLACFGINSACSFILDSKKYKQFEPDSRAVMIVDLVVFQFPQGFDTVMSDGERKFLESFCSDYFDNSGLHLSDWEIITKGNTEYMTMLKGQWEKVKEGKE